MSDAVGTLRPKRDFLEEFTITQQDRPIAQLAPYARLGVVPASDFWAIKQALVKACSVKPS